MKALLTFRLFSPLMRVATASRAEHWVAGPAGEASRANKVSRPAPSSTALRLARSCSKGYGQLMGFH